VYPALALTVPQVVGKSDGILRAPVVRAVTFAGDPMQPHIEDLVSHLADPAYWGVTAEYGVGPLTVGPPIHVTDPAPESADTSQVDAWVQSRFDGTHPEFGTPDSSTIYVVFYPATTGLIYEATPWCGAYHSATTVAGVVGATPVVYAAVADCVSPPSDAAFAPLDLAASHEVAEAATDSCIGGCQGFSVGFDQYAWSAIGLFGSGPSLQVFGSGEVADLCETGDDGFTVPGTLFDVQRVWSNAAMRAGHDPCVPETHVGAPYFNAMPALPDAIDFALDANSSVETRGVQVPMGRSRVVELDLYSDADTHGPWNLTTITYDLDPFDFKRGPHLTVKLDRTTGQNGEKAYLTITRKTEGTASTILYVNSSLGSVTRVWPLAVSQ
jgi:hypothetical protein